MRAVRLAWLIALLAAAAQAQTPTPGCTLYYNGQSTGAYNVGRATTSNAACNGGWIRSPNAPILATGAHGPAALRSGSTIYLYRDAVPEWHGIYLETSTDGVTFTNRGKVIPSGMFPYVVIDPAEPDPGHRWKMLFSVTSGPSLQVPFAQGIAHAYSANGITWTLHNGGTPVIAIGAAGSSDGLHTIMGSMRRAENGTWWLWYSGSRDLTTYESYLPHLATAPAITGPWTKSPANPLLQNRAGANIALSAAWTTGTTLFTNSTPQFRPNEMIFVGGNHINQVLSATSTCPGTNCGRIFVRDPPTIPYAAGTQVRSLYSASVDVTSPLPDLSGAQRFMLVGYEMFNDQGLLLERGGYAIVNTPTPGPTPTGTVPPAWQSTSWSYDYDSGMVLEGGSWDSGSAENPQILQDANTPAVTATVPPALTPTATPTPTFLSTRTPFSCPGGPG